jgi:hypothetical protein
VKKMTEQITFGNNTSSAQSSGTTVTKKPISGKPSEGTIANTIGSGENARNSFIWITIRYCFGVAALISLGAYLNLVFATGCNTGAFIENVKSIWSIFMPVITLALGYAFGKGK